MTVPKPASNDRQPPDLAVSLADLPPANTERWVARRKAQVVAAVQAGLLSLDDALARYKLSLEEFTSWQRALYRHGLRGLQITQLQICKLAERRRRGSSSPGARKAAAWRGQHA
jgi:hypothetical protein